MTLLEFDVLCKSDAQLDKENAKEKENAQLKKMGLTVDDPSEEEEDDNIWIPWTFNMKTIETFTVSRNHRPHACLRARNGLEYIVRETYEQARERIMAAVELPVWNQVIEMGVDATSYGKFNNMADES